MDKTYKRKRKSGAGAPKGNQNARKLPEEKILNVQMFGQRWRPEEVSQILAFLAKNNLSKSEFQKNAIFEYISRKS